MGGDTNLVGHALVQDAHVPVQVDDAPPLIVHVPGDRRRKNRHSMTPSHSMGRHRSTLHRRVSLAAGSRNRDHRGHYVAHIPLTRIPQKGREEENERAR